MTGERELNCLNKVKNEMGNWKKIGLNYKNYIEICNAIKNSIPNDNPSAFPDFVFNNGFIEHFEISSSKTTRKGSKQKMESQEFLREVNKNVKDMKENDTVKISMQQVCCEHSYEYLRKSFKDTWNNHICSLKKYNGAKDVPIFLIEYQDISLGMTEDVSEYPFLLDDIHKAIKNQFYRLCYDKELLRFIYDTSKDYIKYIIFINLDTIDIIKTENIPIICNFLPQKIHIKSRISSECYNVYR